MAIFSIILAMLCAVAAAALLAPLAVLQAQRLSRARLAGLIGMPAEAALLPAASPAAYQLPDGLTRRLVRAGIEPDPRRIVITMLAWLVVIAALVAAAGAFAGLLTGVTLMALAWAVLEYRGAANMRRLSDAMLGFLERVRQLLSVGNSLSVALQRATENSPPIVQKHLMSAIRRIANGSGVADSIGRAAAELDLYELELLATAARTNLRFGGSMTTILRNMIETIRKRNSVERELRSTTTQVRASAWVLALLPLVVGSVVMFTNRDYSRWFLTTEAGHWMIAYAIVSQMLGALCMRMIVRTRY